jgi:DNA-binding winged helix-turn-helix (wHTH) protein
MVASGAFGGDEMAAPYSFGRFTLDAAERRLFADGEPVPLGPTDFRLLITLIENAGAVVTKDDLMSRVWGRAVVGDHVLRVHINTLRKALGGDCIVNKPGRGYRFVAPVRRTEPHAPRHKPRAGNLPSLWTDDATAGPTRLIGRSEQLRSVSELLVHGRLVTLTGHGGVGKTRLALQAAHEASPQFCDGVWLVALASLKDPELVPGAIAAALGVKIGATATPLDTLQRFLARKSLLVVLDNCEHVLAASARTAEALLAAAPNVKILATSREALSCYGERVLEVPPLAVPSERLISPADMRSMAAVELFIERATGADANFKIEDKDLTIIAGICRRLDGLPLAIEMAAGWAGLLGLEALDAKLAGSLKAWLRARSTAPPRHSTLRATLEWSHGLLSAAEQAVLCRLTVFAGSFTMPLPSNPNSRLGRKKRSPIVQGGVKMEATIVGIDVSKDRLDVHVHPVGEHFVVSRNAEGLDALIAKIKPLGIRAVAVEATASSPKSLSRVTTILFSREANDRISSSDGLSGKS